MSDSAQFTQQMAALKELMSAYRYEVTDFEASVWLSIMAAVPEATFIAFLKHHYAVSPYAPKPSDASRYLDPALNADAAFVRMTTAVRDLGPYRDPKISEPILLQAIHLMGGWALVNEQLPATGEEHAMKMKAFKARFDACFNTAVAQIRIERINTPEPLKVLLDKPASRLAIQANPISTHQRPAT